MRSVTLTRGGCKRETFPMIDLMSVFCSSKKPGLSLATGSSAGTAGEMCDDPLVGCFDVTGSGVKIICLLHHGVDRENIQCLHTLIIISK